MLFPANLFTSTKKTKSKPGERTTKTYNKHRLKQITKFTTTKITMHQEYKNNVTPNKLKQLKSPGLVASYDLWPANRAGLSGKGKEVDK